MLSYILRRLLLLPPLIFGITFLSFAIISFAPGDYFAKLLLNPEIDPEVVQQLKRSFGLDKPFIIQYFFWLKNIVTGDFGWSFAYKVPVLSLIKSRVLNTLYLSFLSLLLSWAIAIPLGVLSASRKGGVFDKGFCFLSFLSISMPTFLLAFLLLVLAAFLGLPTGGRVSLHYHLLSPFERVIDHISHLFVPLTSVVFVNVFWMARLFRANMLEALAAPYTLAARARGLPQPLIYKYALKNAMNPLITIFGYQLSGVLSGAALIEIISRWPGLGRLVLEAYLSQDIYVVMASLLISAVLLVLSNLFADILLALTDPRIRYG